MATIVLSAAGMAVGGSIGGSVLGLSSAVIGRAVGASIGRAIDQSLLGQGSDPVEVGRVDRFRLTGASEGSAVPQVYGRVRVGGQVIWASEFEETKRKRGGKGTGPRTNEFSYTVSVAIALCEGVVGGIGRIWADGEEIAPDDLSLRLYPGTETQMPDPLIEAIEGTGAAPGYRGTAYVVIEDLDLGRFGNRVPQFTFEVHRPAQPGEPPRADLGSTVQAVALMPGSGEFTLATSTVALSAGFAKSRPANVTTAAGKADFLVSLDALQRELPGCGSASLIVSWFGGDLRIGACRVEPKTEDATAQTTGLEWRVSGLGRGAVAEVARDAEGRALYGGTPADAAVIEAVRELADRGIKPVFYPFILMDQVAGNGLPDPWSDAADQPHLPWRGRITTSVAPGRPGSTDGTAAAEAEVAAFFGAAQPGDFTAAGQTVTYAGPEEWSYRRFILHYAHLCALAGGVDAFCIGSEMRGMTQIRGADGGFPAVAALRALAANVRAILGPETRIGYAADWSEYHGYQPAGTADKLFHLDPLWADPAIDFIGIDNYMPLSDWRDGEDHLDAPWGRVHNLDYLMANVAGGEGFDWFYHSPEARAAQIRTTITDGDGEPWVWRVKDLRGWWENPHHDRIGGVRQPTPTDWVPGSKPIWFTELGCAAIDKGTNQPNKFLDPKSSESALPHFSNGERDDLIQAQYLRAMHGHFADPQNNPTHPGTGVRMVDMSRAHVWAWDARPWPAFPGRPDVWSDAANYDRGHWLTGRATARPLASVVTEICARAGVTGIDTSGLHGLVRGYAVADVSTARAALQPLMTAYGFDAVERAGVLHFRSRDGRSLQDEPDDGLAFVDEIEGTVERVRAAEAEVAGRVRLSFVAADAAYEVAAAEAAFADDPTIPVTQSELPLVLTRAEGRAIAERWLAEARLARDTARFALPPSKAGIGAGDVVTLGDGVRYRIDRVDQGDASIVDAVRVDPETYRPSPAVSEPTDLPMPNAALASGVEALFLDLPLLTGDEAPHAPYIAAAADPWPGDVALYSAAQDSDYALNRLIEAPSVVGLTETDLAPAGPGTWDRGAALRVRLATGALLSRTEADVLAGANLAAIGDGSPEGWELFQFAGAELVGPDTYAVTNRLRGQAGTDALSGGTWPSGSYFVLLDGSVGQIELPSAARGVTRHLRWGPAARPLGDPSYRYRVESFRGAGLRPYPVAHLRAAAGAGGVDLTWIRRTRIDGDSWDGVEVPLGEESESYLVRVEAGGVLLRQATVAAPAWTYDSAAQAADGASGIVTISVAQVSARFGPGPARSLPVAL